MQNSDKQQTNVPRHVMKIDVAITHLLTVAELAIKHIDIQSEVNNFKAWLNIATTEGLFINIIWLFEWQRQNPRRHQIEILTSVEVLQELLSLIATFSTGEQSLFISDIILMASYKSLLYNINNKNHFSMNNLVESGSLDDFCLTSCTY